MCKGLVGLSVRGVVGLRVLVKKFEKGDANLYEKRYQNLCQNLIQIGLKCYLNPSQIHLFSRHDLFLIFRSLLTSFWPPFRSFGLSFSILFRHRFLDDFLDVFFPAFSPKWTPNSTDKPPKSLHFREKGRPQFPANPAGTCPESAWSQPAPQNGPGINFYRFGVHLARFGSHF